MHLFLMSVLAIATAGVGGCSGSHQVSIDDDITLSGDHVSLHVSGRPDAEISAAGDLSIGSTAVSVTPAQRELLKSYYNDAVAVRDHGIATGLAGANVAGTALSSVAKGLASGNTDKIDAEVNASADKVEAQAANICADLQRIHVTQDALSAQLEAFRPYATVAASRVDDCTSSTKEHGHGGPGDGHQ